LKKQLSPVVTVVVILVVVVIVVLLWMRFSTPARAPGEAGGGMGIGINPPDTSAEGMKRIEAEAAQAEKDLQKTMGGSRGAAKAGEGE